MFFIIKSWNLDFLNLKFFFAYLNGRIKENKWRVKRVFRGANRREKLKKLSLMQLADLRRPDTGVNAPGKLVDDVVAHHFLVLALVKGHE